MIINGYSINFIIVHQSLALVFEKELERHRVIREAIADYFVEEIYFGASHLLLRKLFLGDLSLGNPLVALPNSRMIFNVSRVRPAVSIGDRLIIALGELKLEDLSGSLRVLCEALINTNLDGTI